MNNLMSHDHPTILGVRLSSLENTDLVSQPCGREACGPVCDLGNVHWFPSSFPSWTKSEIYQEYKEVRVMTCQGEDWTWDVCVWTGWRHTSGKKSQVLRGQSEDRSMELDYRGLNSGFNMYKLCDIKQISWTICAYPPPINWEWK